LKEYLMTDNWLNLSGKTCVVTGAASGIGAQVATQLAQAGARTVLLDRDIDGVQKIAQTLKDIGCNVAATQCDISDETSVRSAAAFSADQFGMAYGLVNCAGMLRPGSIRTVEITDWDCVISTNLRGTLLCVQRFLDQMVKGGIGSIVNISSIAAHHPQTYSGAYSAGKAAVTMMSKQLAAEMGEHNVRSNVICPGMIKTALSAAFYAQAGIKEAREALTASRRIGEPKDIANAALFLLSERSSYINGAELVVDGGSECMLMDAIPRPGYSELREQESQLIKG
jgi:glucose 1-dehydrogenase